jgi:hypothetical protein
MANSPLPTQHFTSLFRVEELEERIEFWSATATVTATAADGSSVSGSVTIDSGTDEE